MFNTCAHTDGDDTDCFIYFFIFFSRRLYRENIQRFVCPFRILIRTPLTNVVMQSPLLLPKYYRETTCATAFRIKRINKRNIHRRYRRLRIYYIRTRGKDGGGRGGAEDRVERNRFQFINSVVESPFHIVVVCSKQRAKILEFAVIRLS